MLRSVGGAKGAVSQTMSSLSRGYRQEGAPGSRELRKGANRVAGISRCL